MNPAILEWSAVAFSILGVWLMAQRRMLAWPVGLVSVGLYALVFFEAKLYSDTLLQGAFAAFLLYGWINWHRQDKPDGRIVVAPLPPGHCARDLGLGIAFGLALGAAMHTWTDAALPWLDAMLAALSLVAQWWQARRHAAAWWLWIAVDVVYVGMYAVKSLHATAGLYLLFIGLAVMGLRAWKQATAQEARP
ncbi:nicotinamide riboside transporter PnuC [Flavobacterium sp. MXW15]|uniref:Nicotinamide riboside transporter PnuC n=1 Tax=Xanthomonas chitinilytica TaxID=2989819 RepID=A0ABT3JWY3_9XANT|nr:nicotinamide riboside transporter PnuC [Xanthomonas sp. H13-6]MCW4455776.1 nicotinamide riboside transporter PnuC [Flavobacterium sp. MXW15]MCW4472992.1 nicotinamide riboside transporter PnuC [Xanthomonas sp. H13-6]